MKKLLLLFCAYGFLASCSSDDKPVLASGLELTSSESTLYYDSEMPILKVVITPENVDNKEIKWTSSNNDILSVDAAGKLTLNKFAYGKVTITALNAESGKSATCDLNLTVKKAKIDDYGVVALKSKLGFDVLDRNIGATAKFNNEGTEAQKTAAIGYYFQFGNSIPVGTSEGLNKYYDKESNGGDLDWSKPENTPCPEGWRIPNSEEMKKLTDAAWVDWDGWIQTDEEFQAAKALYNSLLLGRGGCYVINGATKAERDAAKPVVYLPNSSFFWASSLNVTDGQAVSERGFKHAYALEDNSMVILGKKDEVNRAMPIRCIK